MSFTVLFVPFSKAGGNYPHGVGDKIDHFLEGDAPSGYKTAFYGSPNYTGKLREASTVVVASHGNGSEYLASTEHNTPPVTCSSPTELVSAINKHRHDIQQTDWEVTVSKKFLKELKGILKKDRRYELVTRKKTISISRLVGVTSESVDVKVGKKGGPVVLKSCRPRNYIDPYRLARMIGPHLRTEGVDVQIRACRSVTFAKAFGKAMIQYGFGSKLKDIWAANFKITWDEKVNVRVAENGGMLEKEQVLPRQKINHRTL